jgi:hypothetical protein
VLSGPASFSRAAASNQNGVLNIAEAAVSPSLVDGTKAVLQSTLAKQLLLNFS